LCRPFGLQLFSFQFLLFVLVVATFDHAALAKKMRGVIGKDNRVLVPKTHSKHARGIGILYDRKRKTGCTAFCVGNDVIATAAHCLSYVIVKKRKLDRHVRDSAFFLMSNGTVRISANLRTNLVGGESSPWSSMLAGKPPPGRGRISNRAWLSVKDNDWALAKLSEQICYGEVHAFVSSKLLRRRSKLRKAKVFTIGFHGDKNDKRPRFSKCRIRRVTGGKKSALAHHTCDTMPGSSGSPIFINTAEGPRVVALVVGQTSGGKWRRRGNGRKQIISRWRSNIAALPLEILTKLERFETIEFAPYELSTQGLQKELISAGYLTGKADGIAGPQTKAAIMKVEKELGLTPLGLPTKQVMDRLAGK